MSKKAKNGLSLWALVESLQERFEAKGMEVSDVDAAVIGRVGSMLRSKSKNDERPVDLGMLLLWGATAKA